MRVELTGRHLVISPGLRALVERKLAKVERHVSDAGVAASVVVIKEKLNNVVELALHERGEQFLHAVGKGATWATAMNDAVAKVLHQAATVKGKWQERKKRGPAARSVKRPKTATKTRRSSTGTTAAPRIRR